MSGNPLAMRRRLNCLPNGVIFSNCWRARSDAYSPLTIAEQIEQRTKAMTIDELAQLLDVSVKSLYKMVKSGTLPVIQLGDRIRLDPQSIADWLRARTIVTKSPRTRR